MTKTGKNISLHIGTHKTGSTSVQEFLDGNRDRLSRNGTAFYHGSIIASNHIEFYLAALDPKKDSLALRTLDPEVLEGLHARTRREAASFFCSTDARHIIITSEGLSLLRSAKELSILADLLQADRHDINVVCVLRDKSDYLAAYRKQILKVPGRQPSTDPQSSLYVEPDSWLADYDNLLEAYSATFGKENLTTVDYDAQVAAHGDILPATLKALNVGARLIPAPGSFERKNKTTLRSRARQMGHKVRSLFRN